MSVIGFIGLGIMGRPMAKNLIKAGHQLIVHDVVRGSVDDVVASGAARGGSSADVASKSEIAITMLPDGPDVEAAVLGPAGVLEGARKGCIFSQIRPDREYTYSQNFLTFNSPELSPCLIQR